jgi:hypothetical protein
MASAGICKQLRSDSGLRRSGPPNRYLPGRGEGVRVSQMNLHRKAIAHGIWNIGKAMKEKHTTSLRSPSPQASATQNINKGAGHLSSYLCRLFLMLRDDRFAISSA